MNLKEIVAVLLIVLVPVYAQAQSPRAGRVSKGAAGGVPNWDVSASCRAAGKVSYAQQAGENGKILYGERKENTRKACRRLVDVSCRRANKVHQINRMV